MSTSALEDFVKNSSNIMAIRRILFAVTHLPKEMPDHWKTLKSFSRTDLSLAELQVAVENFHCLNSAVFSTDQQLLQEICFGQGSTKPIGVVLVSSKNKCGACGAKLVTRSDRPRNVVLYSENAGTLPATHYRKICSRARHGCSFVQHYGFHSEGNTFVPMYAIYTAKNRNNCDI